MKTILILRHAKSDWGDPSLADFDRPLAKRGLKDAPQMGDVLAQFEVVPDKIISSTAKRAKQTAELVAEACGYRKLSIQWESTFYGANSDDLIDMLRRLPDRVERPMLVGHNPTMEETVSTLLTGAEDWAGGIAIRMPTAALVCLDVDIVEWTTLEPGEATLRWFIIPKLVKAIL